MSFDSPRCPSPLTSSNHVLPSNVANKTPGRKRSSFVPLRPLKMGNSFSSSKEEERSEEIAVSSQLSLSLLSLSPSSVL